LASLTAPCQEAASRCPLSDSAVIVRVCGLPHNAARSKCPPRRLGEQERAWRAASRSQQSWSRRPMLNKGSPASCSYARARTTGLVATGLQCKSVIRPVFSAASNGSRATNGSAAIRRPVSGSACNGTANRQRPPGRCQQGGIPPGTRRPPQEERRSGWSGKQRRTQTFLCAIEGTAARLTPTRSANLDVTLGAGCHCWPGTLWVRQ